MSHSENYTDTGRTTVFYDGMQAGVEKERERIADVIENGFITPLCKCTRCNTAKEINKAIKGEQK